MIQWLMRAKSILALVLLSLASASWACPPAPSSAAMAELKQSGSEELYEYAMARLFKCGWQEARPMFGAALEVARTSDDDDASSMILLLVMNPRSVVTEFAQEKYDDQPLLGPLAIGRDEVEPAVQRFEEALPSLVALVREKRSLDQEAESMLELALASRELRTGHLDDARVRLDRLQQTLSRLGSGEESDEDAHKAIAEIRAAMEDTSSSDDASSQVTWIVDHTTPREPQRHFCGGVVRMPMLDATSIKSQAQLARKDTDGAIGTLLQAHWRELVSGRTESIPDIMHLLDHRYSKSEIRQGWDDAEASIRIEPNFAGFNLFGQFLPLPTAVREDDAASSSPNAYKERPLTQDEALALVRGSALHQAIFGDK